MVRNIGSTKISPFLKSFKWPTNQICCNYYNKELFQKQIMFCFRNSKGRRKYKIYWPDSPDLSHFWNLWLWFMIRTVYIADCMQSNAFGFFKSLYVASVWHKIIQLYVYDPLRSILCSSCLYLVILQVHMFMSRKLATTPNCVIRLLWSQIKS